MRCNRRALLYAGFFYAPLASADWQLNLIEGATEISRSVYSLHMVIFYICVAIAVVVFGVMFWSIFWHRKSRGAKAAHFHESTWIEILWTIIPVAILVSMAVPASTTLIQMYDKNNAELDIQITGYQWKWRYQYLDQDIDFFSNLTTPADQISNEAIKGDNYLLEVDRPMVIPAGKKVRFLITSNDVIHSWWVPALAVKKDAVPGFINEAWTLVDQPGIYRGQCAELCGKDHGFMPIVVEVKSAEDYQLWLQQQGALKLAQQQSAERDWSVEELMSRGEEVYKQSCLACHQAEGQGIPNVFPALAGSPLMNETVDEHIDVVLNGRSGTAMQAFAEQLSASDLAAVITYERGAWGNQGGAVSVQQIKEMLKE
ncbi:cytochrome c oxidase subunit II [Amphritea balenae]|uniref:Cytochrome c oxidase subunit 2 n=1 Tax=Amphritea balenae TaxID=452629 RepID=A0A3P1SJ43_9GAMM|nr:cytochrome c oxidase subunit II [Amphritea balenae]RRC96990.1 cytochrome c oxidase subunit II [Amphritea balenae]GGK85039.1 cytochrome c oxidase subunit 2 [Amphritea balenae]